MPPQRVQRAAPHLGLGQLRLVRRERLAEVVLDPHQRVEPGHRLLEDQPDSGPRSAAAAWRGTPTQVLPWNSTSPSTARRPAAGRSRRGRAWTCRSRTRRPGRAPRPARMSRSRRRRPARRRARCRTRPAGRGRRAPVRRAHASTSDLRYPRRAASQAPSCARRSTGLSTSLSPSPSRVSPVTSSTIARPGNRPVHQIPAPASDDARWSVVAPLGGLGGLDAVAEEARARPGSGSRRRR